MTPELFLEKHNALKQREDRALAVYKEAKRLRRAHNALLWFYGSSFALAVYRLIFQGKKLT